MKKYLINYLNVNYRQEKDKFIVRMGIWNYTDIEFNRSEFTQNNSSYDIFISNFKKMLDGIQVSEEEFQNTYYVKSTLNQLKAIGVIEESKQKQSYKKLIIVDEEIRNYIPKDYMTGIITDIISLKDMDAKLPKELLSRHNELKYQAALSQVSNKIMNKYDELVIILNSPKLQFLNKVNIVTYSCNKPWTLGYFDGSFMNVMSFNTKYTACFNCLSTQEAVRTENYNNFLNYQKNENKYQNLNSISGKDYRLLLAHVEQLETVDYTEGTISALEGKIMSVYLPTYEVNVEDLQRSPICSVCGAESANISERFNISTEEAIKSMLANRGDIINDN